MATPPVFSAGAVLTAAQMNAVGLWLVKSETVGNAVSSVTVSNAFSSDYDAYKIVVSGGVFSTQTYMTLKFGSTTTGYYSTIIYFGYGTATGTANGIGTSNGAQMPYVGTGGTQTVSAMIEVNNPNLAKQTTVSASYAEFTTGNSGFTNGFVDTTTQYTSFILSPATGTWTGGTIRVYGYRK